MSIDTNPSKNWNPYRALAITGAWLALVVLVAVVIGNGCGDTSPAPTNGSMSLSWSITDLGGKPLRCAQVAARSVTLRLLARASDHVTATAFPCEATPSIAQMAPGVYDAAIELLATDGKTVVATAPDQTGIAIVAGQVKRLLPVTFVVRTQGGLPATPTTMNDQPSELGGAGITATALTLERDAGDVAAAMFVRMLCAKPVEPETLTTSAQQGAYLIHVRGELGGGDSWQCNDSTAPRPAGPLPHTVGLTRQGTLGG